MMTATASARNAASSAIFDHPDAAALTALGLHALQHRGQEAAGVVTFSGNRFHSGAPHGPRR